MSLKLKLMSLMVVILGATVFGSYMIFDRSEEELLQQVVQHVKSVENVGNVIEFQHLFTTDLDQSIQHQLLVRTGQRGRVAQISLLDSNYRVRASSIREDVGLSLEELEQKRIYGGESSFWDRFLQKHLKKYDVTFPIYENGRRRGYVNIMLVMNDLEYLIKKAKYSNIFWIISIFAAGTIVAVFMVNRFTRPIDSLVNASKSVANGDFGTSIPMTGSGEISTLISGFNEMTEKLREHRALEERFHHSERMAALGEIGARLAHEIRNPLNSINLIIDHLKDRFSPEEERRQQKFENYLTNIKTELQRLNKLVSDFLKVSRPLNPEMKPIPVKPFITQIAQLLETEAEKNQIRFYMDFPLEELNILGDEDLLKTACLNIALNAIQAMENGGELRIQVRADHVNQSGDGEQCEIIVSDTGPGIPPEHRDNIFQPYFTTKKEGTGLGLAIVNRVIEDHHGTIHVESEAGKGTTIALVLPRRHEDTKFLK